MTAARLLALGAASVLDAGACSGACSVGPSVRPVWTPVAVAGPAFTVATDPGDNLALHRAIAEAPAGSVVVARTSSSTRAIFGDLLSQVARGRGLAGVVTDGAVRDTPRIAGLRFPVFCGAVVVDGCEKRAWGELGVTVRIGAAEIAAGDWIVADDDGVVVVPAAAVDATLERAEAIRREAELVRRALAGESTIDQLGLRPAEVHPERP